MFQNPETEQKVLEDQFKLLVDQGAPIDGWANLFEMNDGEVVRVKK